FRCGAYPSLWRQRRLVFRHSRVDRRADRLAAELVKSVGDSFVFLMCDTAEALIVPRAHATEDDHCGCRCAEKLAGLYGQKCRVREVARVRRRTAPC